MKSDNRIKAKSPSSILNWKPKVTRPGRKWSSQTLILETERYVEARNARLNPPLLLQSSSGRQAEVRKTVKVPLQLQPPVLERQGERRKKARPEVAFALFVGGFAVLFLDVLTIHDGLDAVFFLSLFLGVILIVQGLSIFTRIR